MRKTIVELNDGECKFAVTPHNANSHLFCGAPTPRKQDGFESYCEHHAEICTNGPGRSLSGTAKNIGWLDQNVRKKTARESARGAPASSRPVDVEINRRLK